MQAGTCVPLHKDVQVPWIIARTDLLDTEGSGQSLDRAVQTSPGSRSELAAASTRSLP